MIQLDGHEVKVGDRLWSCVSEWGTVDKLSSELDPAIVMKTGYGRSDTYWPDGRMNSHGPRVLFWDEVKIIPPSQTPKRKVTKTVKGFVSKITFDDSWVQAIELHRYQEGAFQTPGTLTFEAEE